MLQQAFDKINCFTISFLKLYPLLLKSKFITVKLRELTSHFIVAEFDVTMTWSRFNGGVAGPGTQLQKPHYSTYVKNTAFISSF